MIWCTMKKEKLLHFYRYVSKKVAKIKWQIENKYFYDNLTKYLFFIHEYFVFVFSWR